MNILHSIKDDGNICYSLWNMAKTCLFMHDYKSHILYGFQGNKHGKKYHISLRISLLIHAGIKIKSY